MNASSLLRLDRLADRLGLSEGCDNCRGWWSVVLGNDDGERSRPGCCPACGRCVPIGLVLVTHGVDFRDI